jgi:NAD(P)-dependent dehydrogenase (short-subunit alcohol dehydrogenase family)
METTPTDKVFFITGCSSGLGRALAQRVLARGGKVAATARHVKDIHDLVEGDPTHAECIELEVTNPTQCQQAIEAAKNRFGRIDVVVNNAGFGMAGALEELSMEEIRDQYDVNVFGMLNVIKASLPLLRQQRSGHFLNLSSIVGLTAMAGLGIYSSTKFAIEGLSESLADEVRPFGIKVTLIEPGAFRTDFASRSLVRAKRSIAEYAAVHEIMDQLDVHSNDQPGDPHQAADAMIRAVESNNPPMHLLLGPDALKRARDKVDRLTHDFNDWETISAATNFPNVDSKA